jgi:hypothetical protein
VSPSNQAADTTLVNETSAQASDHIGRQRARRLSADMRMGRAADHPDSVSAVVSIDGRVA